MTPRTFDQILREAAVAEEIYARRAGRSLRLIGALMLTVVGVLGFILVNVVWHHITGTEQVVFDALLIVAFCSLLRVTR